MLQLGSLAHDYKVGDLLCWDELGGVLHSGSDFVYPVMRGDRVLRKLPPGGAAGRLRRAREQKASRGR